METKQTGQAPISDTLAPTTLTSEQAEQVAGGLVAGGVLGGGCRTCTSGRPPEFAALAASVNPAV